MTRSVERSRIVAAASLAFNEREDLDAKTQRRKGGGAVSNTLAPCVIALFHFVNVAGC